MSAETKTALRQAVIARVKNMTVSERAVDSQRACALLRQQPVWKQARSILFYAPLATEPDIWPLIDEALALGKIAALPRFSPDSGAYSVCQVRNLAEEVSPGHLGIREPVEGCPRLPLELDLLLVPGVAFDLGGRRLGRGKGYYDQLLTAVSGTMCGVAFDQQIVPEVPVEPHDIHLDCILTPTRWAQR